MTEPLTPEWSWRTLVAGIGSFLGLFMMALTVFMPSMPGRFGAFGLLLAALSQAYDGWVSRDDRVSSEGHVALKDRE